MVNGFRFTHLTVPDGTQDRVEFIKLDWVEMQIVQKRGRQGLELIGGFHQPVQHGVGSDLKDPRRAPNA